MFILYGVAAGLVAGLLTGGRIERLADVRFRLWPVAIGALAIQLALFSPLADPVSEPAARAIYVASTAAVGLVLLANARLPGLMIVLLGAALNLAAIVANGGAMPASPGALASLGLGVGGNTNSVIVDRPALEPLTDVFALPAWLPFANVFSIGDAMIGLGVATAIAAAMRRRPMPPDIDKAVPGADPGIGRGAG